MKHITEGRGQKLDCNDKAHHWGAKSETKIYSFCQDPSPFLKIKFFNVMNVDSTTLNLQGF